MLEQAGIIPFDISNDAQTRLKEPFSGTGK